MPSIMSQNGRKMAKTMHNAAKKFDWVWRSFLCLFYYESYIMRIYQTYKTRKIITVCHKKCLIFLTESEYKSRGFRGTVSNANLKYCYILKTPFSFTILSFARKLLFPYEQKVILVRYFLMSTQISTMQVA